MIGITDVSNTHDMIMKWVHELSDEADCDHQLIGILNTVGELLESGACHMHDVGYRMYKEKDNDQDNKST